MECPWLDGPILERDIPDLNVRIARALPSSQRCKRLAELERKQGVASRCKWDRDLSRTATDLQNASIRRKRGERDDCVDDFRGVSRTDFIVEFGDLVEGGACGVRRVLC